MEADIEHREMVRAAFGTHKVSGKSLTIGTYYSGKLIQKLNNPTLSWS
ncbi:hypothetical protein ACVPOY_02645 [Staphylococcus aureus]